MRHTARHRTSVTRRTTIPVSSFTIRCPASGNILRQISRLLKWEQGTVFHIHAVFLPSNIPHSRVVLYPSEHRVSALFVELAAGRPRPNHNNHSSLSLKLFPNWGFWQTEERTVTRHSLTTPTRSILTFLRVLSCQEIPHRAELRFLR